MVLANLGLAVQACVTQDNGTLIEDPDEQPVHLPAERGAPGDALGEELCALAPPALLCGTPGQIAETQELAERCPLEELADPVSTRIVDASIK